jgi:hypothetical protein
MTHTKRLGRVLEDLDTVAGRLEDGGFDKQRDSLDKAFELIESVKDALEAL